MKRLFIENDENLDFSRIKSYLKDLYDFKGNPADFFDETFTEATFNSQDAWEAIKRNDEIFAESSLIDMMGISGGLLFNNMMYMAIKENVVGKKVHFFSSILTTPVTFWLFRSNISPEKTFTFSSFLVRFK